MIELTAAEVAAATGGRLLGAPDARVTGPVVIDSRIAGPGSLFVAFAGDHVDGHDYVEAALERGASVVLAAREVDAPSVVVVDDVQKALGDLARVVLARVRESADLTVLAITGSVGKTTTKDLIGQILTPSGLTVVPRGSFNNEIGLPLTVLEVTPLTRYLVLEMGATGIGHLDYLTSIAPPNIAVVLAVGAAHLGEFGGIEAVAQAKGELVSGVIPGGVALLNADDLRVKDMAVLAHGEVRTFGTVTTAQIRADDVSINRAGQVSFTLSTGSESAPVALKLVGEHHMSNALAAAAAAHEAGLDIAVIAERLSEAAPISPHRMQVTDRADGVTIIDDSYNANPDSMRAGLKALAVVAGRDRRSVAVLGQMLELGEDSRERHDEVGRLAVRLNVRLLIVVGQDAWPIFDGAQMEGSWGDEVVQVDSIEEAKAILDDYLTRGDVVLVKASNGAGLWRLGTMLAGEGAQTLQDGPTSQAEEPDTPQTQELA